MGIAILKDHKLAFTRKKNDGTGALDVIQSVGDYVLGVVYNIENEAENYIDKREGYNTTNPCYNKLNMKVNLHNEEI